MCREKEMGYSLEIDAYFVRSAIAIVAASLPDRAFIYYSFKILNCRRSATIRVITCISCLMVGAEQYYQQFISNFSLEFQGWTKTVGVILPVV